MTSNKRKEPSIHVSLLTPIIPNFIRTETGKSIPIWHLDDTVLRVIAKNWTALLLLSARNKRKKNKIT